MFAPLTQVVNPLERINGKTNEQISADRSRSGSLKNHVRSHPPFLFSCASPLCSSTIHSAQTIIPHFLLPKAKLPLHFLDVVNPIRHGDPGCSRFFSSDIAFLETPPHVATTKNVPEPVLLVAQIQGEKSYCAIERVRQSIYSILRLARSANVVGLQVWAICPNAVQQSSAITPVDELNTPSTYWWSSALVDVQSKTNNQNSGPKTSKRRKLNSHSEPVRPLTECSPMTSDIAKSNKDVTQSDQTTIISDVPTPDQGRLEDLQPVLISQYIENLYCSKAPVAYFAKGVISRARAVATAEDTVPALAQFLRSIILTVPTLDLKYQTTVINVINASPPAIQSIDNSTSTATRTQPTSQKQSKKLKPAKTGLFPGERDSIQSWWSQLINESSNAEVSTSSIFLARSVSRLRFRETLLQLVLLLEILYIEASLPELDNSAAQLQKSMGPDEFAPTNAVAQPMKQKKPRDLSKLVDILIDRLIIWQSVDMIEDGPTPGNKAEQGSPRSTKEATYLNDELKDFYHQLVATFYGSRLPAVVVQIGKKLGVSSSISKASSLSARPGEKVKVTPGTEISRSNVHKDHELQAKKSSNMSKSKHRRHPSLLRSVTDTYITKGSAISGKTDEDQSLITTDHRRRSLSRSVSLSRDGNISRPLSRSNSVSQSENTDRTLSRSNSISMASQNLKQREVDLSAIAKFQKSNSKRPYVENELKNAISALKKPNRSLAGRNYMDAIEQRLGNNDVQKTTSFTKRSIRTDVEVNMTPKRTDKTRKAIIATPRQTKSLDPAEARSNSPTSTSHIPLSANGAYVSNMTHMGNRETALITSTPAKQYHANPVFETPTCRIEPQTPQSLRPNQASYEQTSQGRRVYQTPIKSSSGGNNGGEIDNPKVEAKENLLGMSAVFKAHNHHESKENMIEESCTMTDKSSRKGQASIYDALGWNDDMDELS